MVNSRPRDRISRSSGAEKQRGSILAGARGSGIPQVKKAFALESKRIANGVLTTRWRELFSIVSSFGSPSIRTRTASCFSTRIFGGSAASCSDVFFSRSAAARSAVRLSRETTISQCPTSDSTIALRSFSWPSVISGKRTLSTVAVTSVAVRASRSVRIRAVAQRTPKTGSAFPCGVSENADRAFRRSPFIDSTCGS